MKKVIRKQVVYVAYDGTSFSSVKLCEQYEKDHPEPASKVLKHKMSRLSDVEREIRRHKAKEYAYLDSKLEYAWYCGRMHQDALWHFRSVIKERKDMSNLDFYIQLGKAASEVKKWKDLEKEAAVRLANLRKERILLEEEVNKLKEEEKKAQEKEAANGAAAGTN